MSLKPVEFENAYIRSVEQVINQIEKQRMSVLLATIIKQRLISSGTTENPH